MPLALTVLTGLAAGLLTIGQAYALSSTINDVFLRHQDLRQVWPWMELLLAIAAARALLVWINEVAANCVAVHIKKDLRERLFAHILALGPAYTRGERTGDLTTAAVDGIEALDAYFSQYLPQLVISAAVPVAILVLVFPLDPLSGIVLLLTAPLIPFFMYMIGRGAEAATKEQYETLSRLSAHFLDSLQGLTTLKLFGQSKAHARNIAAVSEQYRDTTLKVLQVTFLSAFALELLATVSTAIIAVEVGLRLLYGQLQFQEALFLLLLAPEFYLPLRMLGVRFHAGMAGTSAARRIFGIFDVREPNASGPESNVEEAAAFETGEWGPFQSLELSGVSYVYPGEDRPALQDISLRINAGEHVALVGPSGSGKSTLANLLLRFMEPGGGGITWNGQPAGSIPIERWHELISWVPQNPHLFQDTLAANMRLGRPEATEEDLAAATKAAHLEEFIASLPEKYETMVGEAGARLSSGQAQRVALARAFLKNSPILIMDEPTSSLDPETEDRLEESTKSLMQGRTVITIAHRLNTIASADHIYVLQQGRIVETGTHSELRAGGGAYAAALRALKVEGRTPRVDQQRSSTPSGLAPAWQDPTRGGPRPKAEPSPEVRQTHRAEDGAIFVRLLSFLHGSWGWVGLSVLLGSLTIGASVALMGTSTWLISMAALHPSIAALEIAIVGVRFFGIARAVFRYLERLVSHNVTFRLLGQLRTWFYERLEPLAPARLMDYRAGDLLARIIGDVNTLENFYVRVLAPPATAVLVCIGASAFLALTDLRLAALLIACFLLLGLALPLLVQAASRETGSQMVAQHAEIQAQLVDGIQGLSDILAFGRGPERVALIRTAGGRYGGSQRRMAQMSGIHMAVFTLVTNLAPWLVLYIAIPQVVAGRISGVMLAPLILITSSAFEAVASLPLAAQTWSGSRAAAGRLFETVEAEPAVKERAQAVKDASLPVSRGNVDIDDLDFAYPGQTVHALQGVSLGLRPGKVLAVVGPSGAGKSTLASLLLRFWDFEQGEIRMDGRSIRDLEPDEVRAQISLISPNTYFFNTSVYENLRMARRRVSREEVEAAAHAAQIHDFVATLPKGYDTLIGEQGLRLSAGERQRLAIARAILKDAPILILDEPTANLDARNEAEILKTLFHIMQRKAGLLTTHRLIGLENVDEILVLEHGRIVERGSQEELLGRNGPYSSLWEHQNRFLAGQ
ncbi:MAG TPA: thiol reductant ABC exporter subunit CydD [Anaerolineales bacterium]